MNIWIDADACPRPARELVVRFALKRNCTVILVAGQSQAKPPFQCVRLVVVPSGPDAADDYIVAHAQPGDMAICSDIPLAARLVANQVATISPRGEIFTEHNMGDRLAMRNLFTGLRDSGQLTSGQAPYSERDKQQFANALDSTLQRLTRQRS